MYLLKEEGCEKSYITHLQNLKKNSRQSILFVLYEKKSLTNLQNFSPLKDQSIYGIHYYATLTVNFSIMQHYSQIKCTGIFFFGDE